MIRKIGCLVGLVGCLAMPCVAGAQNPQPAAPNEPALKRRAAQRVPAASGADRSRRGTPERRAGTN